MTNNRHVFCPMSGSQARLIVTKYDIEDPMQAIFDGLVGTNSYRGGFSGKIGGRDVKAGIGTTTILEFGA